MVTLTYWCCFLISYLLLVRLIVTSWGKIFCNNELQTWLTSYRKMCMSVCFWRRKLKGWMEQVPRGLFSSELQTIFFFFERVYNEPAIFSVYICISLLAVAILLIRLFAGHHSQYCYSLVFIWCDNRYACQHVSRTVDK